MLLGDLAYETIKKIFDYSEYAERSERLSWEVLLAPHHCSKKVMYVVEGENEVLKQDVLDLLEGHTAGSSVVVVSSATFPETNKTGDNPPHLLAQARYEEIADDVICTGEYPDVEGPRPVVFTIGEDGFALNEVADTMTEALGKAAAVGGALAAGGILAALAGTAITRRRRRQPVESEGLSQVRHAVTTVRGDEAAPQQAVGFGRL